MQSGPVLSPDESTLYVGSGEGDNYVYAINAADGAQVWRFATEAPCESPAKLSDDGTVVFIGCDDAHMYAIHAVGEKAGELMW